MKNTIKNIIICIALLVFLQVTGIFDVRGTFNEIKNNVKVTEAIQEIKNNINSLKTQVDTEVQKEEQKENSNENSDNVQTNNEQTTETNSETIIINGEIIPEWDGSTPFYVVNENVPFFESLSQDSFEIYSDLDDEGRCGEAFANISTEIMPTEKREGIGSVYPSGWNQGKYPDLIPDGKYLYNRCHLIGFQLAGENANTKNLITGTRYMNVEGMEPFENEVAIYCKQTGNHVYYRVTPIFIGDELVARGVLIEAQSVEDDQIMFCVYCYNVQPGVTINYADGSNYAN